MALAIATHTSPADWRDEDDAVIATAIHLLEQEAEEIEKAASGK